MKKKVAQEKSNIQASKGYVYILTNPSFREDWVKIGKSSRPVDVRSKELDNTAVPLPFEIYATMKTSHYGEIEGFLHSILGKIAGKRIRSNREFFNVSPEDALEAFHHIAKIIDDAEIFMHGREPEQQEHTVFEPKVKTRHTSLDPNYNYFSVESHTEELPKGAKYSWNGTDYYSMAEFVPKYVKYYTQLKPLTLNELKITFKDEWLKDGFPRLGLIVKLDDIKNSNIAEADKVKSYKYHNPDLVFTSKDHYQYCVSNQWGRNEFRFIIQFILGNGGRIIARTTKVKE